MTWRFLPATEFASVAQNWDALNEVAGGIPFLESACVQAALTNFGTGREIVALHEDRGCVTKALILKSAGIARWHTFQPSQLPLGSFLQVQGANLNEAAPELIRSLPGTALVIGLTQLDPVMVPRPAEGATLSALDYIKTAWVELNDDFDSYWASRGKNLRDNVKKLTKKVAADGITVRLEQLTTPGDMRSAIADYARLETAGWKRAIGTAVAMDTAQGRFYVDMMERMAARGQARVYRYFFNDTVVTMDLCVDRGGTMVVLKTAYDEQFAKLSPATLMREQIFRDLFAERRIRRVEFYGPLMEWHTRWTELSRTLYHANLFRNGAVSRLIDLVRVSRRRLGRGSDEITKTDEG